MRCRPRSRIGRYRFPGRDFIRGLFSLPLLVPYISLGIGIASFFYAARLNGTLAAVVLAHMIAALPFGVMIVTAAVEELTPEIEEAALACGAAPPTVFWKVMLAATGAGAAGAGGLRLHALDG